jgi:hypothetical protein
MDFLIASAMAQDGAPPAGGTLASFIPLILIVVIFWFLLIRPQMKRNKQHRELVAGLSAGDEDHYLRRHAGPNHRRQRQFRDVEAGRWHRDQAAATCGRPGCAQGHDRLSRLMFSSSSFPDRNR